MIQSSWSFLWVYLWRPLTYSIKKIHQNRIRCVCVYANFSRAPNFYFCRLPTPEKFVFFAVCYSALLFRKIKLQMSRLKKLDRTSFRVNQTCPYNITWLIVQKFCWTSSCKNVTNVQRLKTVKSKYEGWSWKTDEKSIKLIQCNHL